MSLHTSRSSRFIKRAALSLALCGGLTLSQGALAQERGLLAEDSPGAFNAAGQASKDTGPGPVEGFSVGGNAQVQGNVGQPLQPGQVIDQNQPVLSDQPVLQNQPVLQGQQVLPGQPGLLAPHSERQGMQLGVQVADHEHGLQVVSVREDSAAKKAGLKEGDVIVRFNDQEVRDVQWLQSQISQMQANSEAKLVVMRGDEEQTLTAKFEENRYSAARPAMDDSLRAELDALREEVKQLRSELQALKQQNQDQAVAPEAADAPPAPEATESTENSDAAVENQAAEADANAEPADSDQPAEASEAADEASEEVEQ